MNLLYCYEERDGEGSTKSGVKLPAYRVGHPADLPAIFLVVGAGFLAEKWSQVCRNRPFGEGVVEAVLSLP